MTRQLPPGINSGGSESLAADTSRDPRALLHAAALCCERPARLPLHATPEPRDTRTCTDQPHPIPTTPQGNRAPPRLVRPESSCSWSPVPAPAPLTALSPSPATPTPSLRSPQPTWPPHACSTHPLLSFQMARSSVLLLAWLLLAATLSATLGLGMPVSARDQYVKHEDQPGAKNGSFSPWQRWGRAMSLKLEGGVGIRRAVEDRLDTGSKWFNSWPSVGPRFLNSALRR